MSADGVEVLNPRNRYAGFILYNKRRRNYLKITMADYKYEYVQEFIRNEWIKLPDDIKKSWDDEAENKKRKLSKSM